MKYDFLIQTNSNFPQGFTQIRLTQIEEALDKCPVQIVNKIYSEGWKIVAFENDADLPNDYQGVVGAVICNERRIYLKNNATENFTNIAIHEFSHVFDIRFNRGINKHISTMDVDIISDKLHRIKIQELWNGECSEWMGASASEYHEFWAEACTRYILGNGNIAAYPQTTQFVKSILEENNSLFLDSMNRILNHSITSCTFDELENKINFQNRYGDNKGSISLPSSGGSNPVDQNIVFDKTKNFDSKYSDFPIRKITYSYISANHNESWGEYILMTDRNIERQGVIAYQERVLVLGEPNTEPLFRECRYWETNVSNNWSPWYPIGGESQPQYQLPVATSSTLGGVKQGTNVSISSNGAISAATATTTTKGVASFDTLDFTVSSGKVSLKKTTSAISVLSNSVTLTTDPYQYTSTTIATNLTIKLPTTSVFTEIRYYFKASANINLTFPSTCKIQGEPKIEANKTYECIFTYINSTIGWIGGVVAYG